MNRRAADPLDEVRRLHSRAVDEYAAAHPTRARQFGRRALAVLHGVTDGRPVAAVDRLHARVLLTVALSEAELGRADAAAQALADAAELARRLDEPAISVLVRSQRGALAIRRGDFPAAVAEYSDVLPLIEYASAFDRGVILSNSAVAHLYSGDLRRARPLFNRAVRAAAQDGSRREEAKRRHNLGYLEFLAGDLPGALQQMAEARAVSPDLPDGIGLLDRARVLAEAGLLREANSLLSEAAQVFRRDRMTQDLGEVELERATAALVAGDVDGARRFAAAARDRFRKRGADRWRRSAELVLLEGDLAAGRPGRRLTGPAARLQNEFAAAGAFRLARAAALVGAQAHLVAGDVRAAEAVVAGIPATSRADPVTARLQEHYVRAQLDVATGRRTAATQRITRGLTELARYQASFGSLDLASAAAVHGRRLASYGIALARAGGRPAEVFAAAERARAVTSRLTPVRPPDDPVAADLLGELRRTVESLRALEQDRVAAAPLLVRRQDLERAIIARSWSAAGSGAVDRSATLARVRAVLAESGATMISFVQAAGELSAVTAGRQVRLSDLGTSATVVEHVRRTRADLDVLAQPRLPGGIRAAVRASLDRSLRELDRCLIEPLRVDGPLVIVSTGALGQLPWASLPSLRGRPLVVAPSASKWLTSSSGAPRWEDRVPVVAICGPDLRRGEREAATVAANWPLGQVVAGPAATTAAFIDSIAGSRVLHVAAHGVHQAENPLFSFVRMADGPVFAHELDRTMHAPEHVILSACEVGVSTVRPGDEALGLASALLQFGTRSVVAGVARVGDDVAEDVMVAYHRSLAAGTDSAAALADALCVVDSDVVPPFVNFGASWQRLRPPGRTDRFRTRHHSIDPPPF